MGLVKVPFPLSAIHVFAERDCASAAEPAAWHANTAPAPAAKAASQRERALRAELRGWMRLSEAAVSSNDIFPSRRACCRGRKCAHSGSYRISMKPAACTQLYLSEYRYPVFRAG